MILLLIVNNVIISIDFHMINHHVKIAVRQIITNLVVMYKPIPVMLLNVINVKLAAQHVLMLMIALLVIHPKIRISIRKELRVKVHVILEILLMHKPLFVQLYQCVHKVLVLKTNY